MGFLDSLLGFVGFGIGILLGLLLGFFVFIYSEPTDSNKDPVTKSLDDFDSSSILDLILELPLWVMSPDYERVDWLNKIIHDVWPYFDKAACGIIKNSAEATFAEYIGKYHIRSIFFERLSLGNLPPKIYGLKAQESKQNEIVLDLALRWAGNPDIVLAINLFSVQLEVQLVDLQISGATRIVLRPFVPTLPCFSSIAISLMDKPKIDFGLRVMGGDIMSIPGLYHLIQEVAARQVAKLYLWPQTFEIDILDDSIAAKKPVGILHVKIVRAHKLLDMDLITTSDPYVKLSLTGERLTTKKTTIKMNNLNPEWYEEFKLTVKDPESQVLQLQLYDWDKVGADDYLGMQTVPLNMLVPYEKKEFVLGLLHSTDPNDPRNKRPRGEITLEMTFVPFQEDSKKFSGSFCSAGNRTPPIDYENTPLIGTGLLLVRIVEAENVEGKYQTNPYATVTFRGDRRKTRSIKKTRNPHWNEEFEFVLDDAPVRDMIHIEVMSKRRKFGFMMKELLGYVDINMGDVVHNGHINEKFHLINSRYGILHLDIRWKVI